MHSEKPICALCHLSSFPNVAFETVPMFIWLTMALYHSFKEDRLVLPLSTPLSSRIDGVMMSLVLSPEVVPQAPQHLFPFVV